MIYLCLSAYFRGKLLANIVIYNEIEEDMFYENFIQESELIFTIELTK